MCTNPPEIFKSCNDPVYTCGEDAQSPRELQVQWATQVLLSCFKFAGAGSPNSYDWKGRVVPSGLGALSASVVVIQPWPMLPKTSTAVT